MSSLPSTEAEAPSLMVTTPSTASPREERSANTNGAASVIDRTTNMNGGNGVATQEPWKSTTPVPDSLLPSSDSSATPSIGQVGSEGSVASKPRDPKLSSLSRSGGMKRPPSLSELTAAMRMNPEKWDKLRQETESARGINVASNPNSNANPSNPTAAPSEPGEPSNRLKLLGAITSKGLPGSAPTLQRSHSSNAAIPTSSTLAASKSSNGERPGANLTSKGLPSLAAIEKRFAGKEKERVDGQTKEREGQNRGDEKAGTTPESDAMTRSKTLDPKSLNASQSVDKDFSKTIPAEKVVPSASAEATTGNVKDATNGPAPQEKGTKAGEHPLQYPWTLYYDSRSTAAKAAQLATASSRSTPVATPSIPSSSSVDPFSLSAATGSSHPPTSPAQTGGNQYEAALQIIGNFDTVESFCRYFNWTKRPSQLDMNANVHLFKNGIKPMWEDPANTNGGKWVLTVKSGNLELLDRCWTWLVFALVGEELDERDEVCGAVVSAKPRGYRIQLWIKDKQNVERINSLGKKIVKLLEIGDETGISFEFQYHHGTTPSLGASKFISLGATTTSSSFSRGSPISSPQAPGVHGGNAPGLGFAAFASSLGGVRGKEGSVRGRSSPDLAPSLSSSSSFGPGGGGGGVPPGLGLGERRGSNDGRSGSVDEESRAGEKAPSSSAAAAQVVGLGLAG